MSILIMGSSKNLSKVLGMVDQELRTLMFCDRSQGQQLDIIDIFGCIDGK